VTGFGLLQVLLHLLGLSNTSVGETAFGFSPYFWLLIFADLSGSTTAHLLNILACVPVIVVGTRLVSAPTAGGLRALMWLEAVLAGPSMLLFVFILAASLESSHGMSTAEIVIPSAVFIVAAFAPWWIARRCLEHYESRTDALEHPDS